MTTKEAKPWSKSISPLEAPARPFTSRSHARMNALADLVEAHASVKQLEAAEVDIRLIADQMVAKAISLLENLEPNDLAQRQM